MTTSPALLTSFENKLVERTLLEVVRLFELHFPNRVRSYYIEGSYADGSSVGSSDLDLMLVFRDKFNDKAEYEEATRMGVHCANLSEIELDFGFEDEAGFAEVGLNPSLKLNSLLAYGEDIRDKFQIVPIEQWTRDRIHSSYWRTVRLFNRSTPVTLPLDYPLPSDEFFGYCQRLVKLPDGRKVPCTRDLIRLVSWSATALIAYRKRQYVVNKRQSLKLYREVINDEWADLLGEIYQKCRGEWNYLIPEEATARRQLREICQRTLAFENHFMEAYQNFVAEEWASSDATARKWVSDFLQAMPLQGIQLTKD